MNASRLAQLLVAAVVLAAVVAIGAPPAGAHDVGSLLSNYETRLTSVTPQVDGIEVAVIEGGNRIEVRNDTDEELVVLGYEGEPYLRVGPEGVFENLNSPATYVNADRDATTAVPDRAADPTVEPEWRQISDAPLARWHDHRIHWMSSSDPPVVQEAPGEEHVVIEGWVVPMTFGDETIEVVGDLVWLPAPSPALPAVLVLVLAGALTATGLLGSWRLWSAAGVVLLLAGCTTTALGLGFFTSGSTTEQLGEALADALYLPFLLVAGVVSVVLLARRHPFAPYLTIFVGAVGGLFGGLLEARMLTNSVLPTALDAAVARGLVAAILGLGLGLLGAGVVAIVRTPAAATVPPGEPAPTTS